MHTSVLQCNLKVNQILLKFVWVIPWKFSHISETFNVTEQLMPHCSHIKLAHSSFYSKQRHVKETMEAFHILITSNIWSTILVSFRNMLQRHSNYTYRKYAFSFNILSSSLELQSMCYFNLYSVSICEKPAASECKNRRMRQRYL